MSTSDEASTLLGPGDHGPVQWRQAAALFGPAGWDIGALASARVVSATDDIEGAAAVAGAEGAARRLGQAGVVAIRAGASVYELRETVDGWRVVPSAGTPDPASLAITALVTATQVESERRTRGGAS